MGLSIESCSRGAVLPLMVLLLCCCWRETDFGRARFQNEVSAGKDDSGVLGACGSILTTSNLANGVNSVQSTSVVSSSKIRMSDEHCKRQKQMHQSLKLDGVLEYTAANHARLCFLDA